VMISDACVCLLTCRGVAFYGPGSKFPTRKRQGYSFPNGRHSTARHGHGSGTARSGPRACHAVPDSAAVPSARYGHGTKLSRACRAGPFGTAARSCSFPAELHLFQYRKIHLASYSTKNQKNTAEHITDSNKKERAMAASLKTYLGKTHPCEKP
jgi:hypothetical protein